MTITWVLPNPALIRSLWQAGHTDPLWPLATTDAGVAAFEAWCNEWALAEDVGWGRLRVIQLHHTIAGWVTFREIDDTWFDDNERTFEAGTYLLPAHRGIGLNPGLKWETLRHAAAELDCNWLVYAVPEANELALRSLERITGVSSDPAAACIDTSASPRSWLQELTRAQPDRFRRWWRYMEWKHSCRLRLFVARA